jgi:signal peptidase I
MLHSSDHPAPNRWIAAALGFLIQPLGLLYVQKPIWALCYFVLSLGSIAYGFTRPGPQGAMPWHDLFTVGLAIASSFHAFRAASRWPSEQVRAGYARWRGLLGAFAGVVFLAVIGRSFFWEPFRVPSKSMEPALPRGSNVIVEKWGFGNYGTFGFTFLSVRPSRRPQRGDIIVFDFPVGPSKTFIFRAVGGPGDKVVYKSKELFVNEVSASIPRVVSVAPSPSPGDQVSFSERLDGTTYETLRTLSLPAVAQVAVRDHIDRDRFRFFDDGFECAVPEGKFLVLGDNRDNANDGRYWGFVPSTAILGRLLHVYAPTGPAPR